MPVQFSIDHSARLVSYEVSGTPTSTDLEEFLDAVITDPAFRKGFNFVGDRRSACPETPANYIHEIARLVRQRATSLGSCRWAVVVASEDGFGVVRVWSMLTESVGLRVAPFTDPARAREWATSLRSRLC